MKNKNNNYIFFRFIYKYYFYISLNKILMIFLNFFLIKKLTKKLKNFKIIY